MSENKPSPYIQSGGGFLRNLTLQVKLIIRLMGDKRVSPFLKLLPIGAVVYLVNPVDIPGPIDDAAVLWLGSYLFVELCPEEVVKEHMAALKLITPTTWEEPSAADEDVIEGEFKER